MLYDVKCSTVDAPGGFQKLHIQKVQNCLTSHTRPEWGLSVAACKSPGGGKPARTTSSCVLWSEEKL